MPRFTGKCRHLITKLIIISPIPQVKTLKQALPYREARIGQYSVYIGKPVNFIIV
jgi:hypothetical protein